MADYGSQEYSYQEEDDNGENEDDYTSRLDESQLDNEQSVSPSKAEERNEEEYQQWKEQPY